MKVGIAGYGNLGKAVEKCLVDFPHMELVGIFTRRNVNQVNFSTANFVYPFEEISKFKGKIDVMINCMGSSNDLAFTTALLAKNFNVIDAFDNIDLFNSHYNLVNSVANNSHHTAIVGAGINPGLFSIARLFSRAFLPKGKDYTFYKQGISLRHSQAVRQIDGVLDAKRFITPYIEPIAMVKQGKRLDFKPRDLYSLVCYVCSKQDANLAKIEAEIKSMPYYFAEFNTKVNFIDYESFLAENLSMSGQIDFIRFGFAANDEGVLSAAISYDSESQLTANVLLNFTNAVFKINQLNIFGALTVLDIKPSDLIDDDILNYL